MQFFKKALLLYLVAIGFLAVSVQQLVCVPAHGVGSISSYPPAEAIELVIYELALVKLACGVVIVADAAVGVPLRHEVDKSTKACEDFLFINF